MRSYGCKILHAWLLERTRCYLQLAGLKVTKFASPTGPGISRDLENGREGCWTAQENPCPTLPSMESMTKSLIRREYQESNSQMVMQQADPRMGEGLCSWGPRWVS